MAKVASDINRPNGITVIPPDQASAFIDQFPILDAHICMIVSKSDMVCGTDYIEKSLMIGSLAVDKRKTVNPKYRTDHENSAGVFSKVAKLVWIL